MKDLEGRAAVITGAGSGIGRATARSLAARKARLVLVDINAESVEAVAAEIRNNGGGAVALAQNIAEPDAFEVIKRFAEDSFGPVDILMNNAALLFSGALEDVPIDEWETILNINVISMVRSLKLFVPEMVARGNGHIVNTSSFSALYPYAYDRLPYVASKSAVLSMSEALALYTIPRGVGMTVLLPGPVRTGIGGRAKKWSPHLGLRPPGEEFPFVEPEDVGELVVKGIQEEIFFLPTDDQVYARIQRRAADPNAFLAAQIAQMPPV